jgi:hypothetical protein|tara:strand:+ start:14469 stop:15023 length:555 start_codon:yes stop_codon:yes gene_type:complete
METKFTLQTGDIISTYTPFEWKRPMTYMAPLIRFFTKYKYTHVAIALECWGSMFICEAFTSGIIIRPVKEFPDKMKVSVIRPNFEIDKIGLSKKALSKVSTTKYDLLSLVFFQIIYQITGKWYGHTKARKAEKKFYCSEYVAWLYMNVFSKWYMTTPEDIHKSEDFTIVFEGWDHELITKEDSL